jgi:hypothetical protein
MRIQFEPENIVVRSLRLIEQRLGDNRLKL